MVFPSHKLVEEYGQPALSERAGGQSGVAGSAPASARSGGPGACAKGRVLLADGAVYEGSWLGSKRHGEGSLTWPDGSRFVGQFQHDEMHGLGTHASACGSQCTGQWVQGLQHGHAMERWADGSVFEGQFHHGMKSGRGRLVWVNGCAYEGEFSQNRMHGRGCYSWGDGRRYAGQWLDNSMGLRGKMEWPDGRTYEGDFKNSQKHGHGTLCWPDGHCYCGEWREDRQHGQGVARTMKGLECRSRWEHGRFMEWIDEGCLVTRGTMRVSPANIENTRSLKAGFVQTNVPMRGAHSSSHVVRDGAVNDTSGTAVPRRQPEVVDVAPTHYMSDRDEKVQHPKATELQAALPGWPQLDQGLDAELQEPQAQTLSASPSRTLTASRPCQSSVQCYGFSFALVRRLLLLCCPCGVHVEGGSA